MIRPKTVSYLVDGYTPINNLRTDEKGKENEDRGFTGKGVNSGTD